MTQDNKSTPAGRRYTQRISLIAFASVLLLAGFAFRIHITRARAARLASLTPPEPYFPAGSFWLQDISHAPLDPQSDNTIAWLANAGGWGTGKLRVDFAIRVLQADASTPMVPFHPASDFYEPDSDLVSQVPLPVGGGMEGHSSYQCPVKEEDCHLIVVDHPHAKLYEAWDATFDGKSVSAVFFGVWNLNRVYPPSGRGDQCTSADAAGFPIAPLLFSADELARGSIDHAIRFILPNDRIRAGVFVHPATHAGGPKGPDAAPPYGVHLRLKASVDISNLKPAAQIVARAMQKYGIFLSDGGEIALTAQNDADTKTKYSDFDFEAGDLQSLKVTDFEIVKHDKPIHLTNDCVRNP